MFEEISKIEISIITWNVLADCYAYGSSQRSDLLNFTFRWPKIERALRDANADIYCLQEIDKYDGVYRPFFESIGYTCVYTQRPTKEDGCLIAYNPLKHECIRTADVYYDKVADMISVSHIAAENYRRHNVGNIVRLRSLTQNAEFIVANTHIFWNPAKPEVKMEQVKMLKGSLNEFMQGNPCPVIVAGDFNSLPNSAVYQEMVGTLGRSYDINESLLLQGRGTKFLCDGNLNRLCRWMRVLGIDTALESADSTSSRAGKTRPANSYAPLFERAKAENRVFLTSSKRLQQLSTCPQSFLVKPGPLEDILVDICQEFKLDLDPERFLVRS